VIAIAATYPADQLQAANLVVERLTDLSVVWNQKQAVFEVNARPSPVQ
jgi:hypothetical protein